MVAIGKQGQTHVRKDKVLCQEVDEFKDFLSPPPRLQGHVDVSVVGLHYATEQHCNNT